MNRGTKNSYISNQILLKKFLDKFDKEKGFCLSFYGVPEEFVSKLVNNGKNAICTSSELYNYLKLATEFWAIRLYELRRRAILNPDECNSYEAEITKLNTLLDNLITQ